MDVFECNGTRVKCPQFVESFWPEVNWNMFILEPNNKLKIILLKLSYIKICILLFLIPVNFPTMFRHTEKEPPNIKRYSLFQRTNLPASSYLESWLIMYVAYCSNYYFFFTLWMVWLMNGRVHGPKLVMINNVNWHSIWFRSIQIISYTIFFIISPYVKTTSLCLSIQ